MEDLVVYNIKGLNIFYNKSNSMFSSNLYDEMLEAELDTSDLLNNFTVDNINLCVNISNACNLNCKYCFNNEKDGRLLDANTINKYIDDFLKYFPNCQKYYIDLSGKGEPLLNLKTIYAIKEHCNELSNKMNREFLVSFVSNGVLLSPKVAEELQNKGILFGVSLDGNKKAHDAYRLTQGDQPTYDLIMNNIKSIKYRDYIGCAVTLTDKVFSLVDSLKELGEYFKTISYKPVRDQQIGLNDNNINSWLQEYDKLTDFLVKTIHQNNLKYIKILLNGDDYFGKFLYRVFTNERTLNRCDAGITRFALDYDGKIYECSPKSFSNYEEVTVDPYNNFMNQMSKSQISCESCPFYYICGGECAVNKANNNNQNDSVMCTYKQGLIKYAMYLREKILSLELYDQYNEIVSFCEEKSLRGVEDKELRKFLDSHPENNFVDGKAIFDKIKSRY